MLQPAVDTQPGPTGLTDDPCTLYLPPEAAFGPRHPPTLASGVSGLQGPGQDTYPLHSTPRL